jgi:hypothetical protein
VQRPGEKLCLLSLFSYATEKMLRAGLKETFLQKLTLPERLFFLQRAREAILRKGYRPGEDLFWYSFYLTLRERLRGTDSATGDSYARFLLVHGPKEIEDTIKSYEKMIEQDKRPSSGGAGEEFIDYFFE